MENRGVDPRLFEETFTRVIHDESFVNVHHNRFPWVWSQIWCSHKMLPCMHSLRAAYYSLTKHGIEEGCVRCPT